MLGRRSVGQQFVGEWLTRSIAILHLLLLFVACSPRKLDESLVITSRRLQQSGLPSDRLKIIDPDCGRKQTIAAQPNIVSIQLENPVGTAWWHICQGIRVSQSVVLTTASCIWDLREIKDPQYLRGNLIPNIYSAIAPYCRHQTGEDRFQVQSFVIHPEFTPPGRQLQFQLNDIALLMLNTSKIPEEWVFRDYLVDVDTSVDRSQVENDTLPIIGYGQKNSSDSAGSFAGAYYVSMLQHDVDEILILDVETCRQKLRSLILEEYLSDEYMEMYLCGEMVVGDLCVGDYGSPLLQQGDKLDIVLGLYSWSLKKSCNEGERVPILLTNRTHYSKWIIETVELLDPFIIPPPSPPPPYPSPYTQRLIPPLPPPLPPEKEGDSFPIWIIGLIIAVVIAGIIIIFLIYRRRRRRQGSSDQSQEPEFFLDKSYSSGLIRSLDKDLDSSKDIVKSAFQSDDDVGLNSRKNSFPITPDDSVLELNLNYTSYPVNTKLLLSGLHRRTLRGEMGKRSNEVPFNWKLVMVNRPQVDAIVSLQDQHPITQYSSCYISPEIPPTGTEAKDQALLTLRLLSQLNIMSTVPKAHIHRTHSELYKSYLKRKSKRYNEKDLNLFKDEDKDKSIVQSMRDRPMMMFPLASDCSDVLEAVDSNITDFVEMGQAKSDKMLEEMKQQLQASGMFIDVPKEIEFGRRLGGGNFGTVFEGLWIKHNGFKVPVAVKLMKASHCDSQTWQYYARHFMEEINMMARIKSEYVIQLYGGFITRDEFVIVMELMQHGSLDSFIRRRYRGKPLPLVVIVKIMLQIAKGLSELHPSVVHRDLKPQNLLLDANDKVKIADLGLSKMKTATMMSVSDMKGTPAYIAPEVFMNSDVSEKCDMYAFAVIMWECITGQKPWAQYHMPVQIMHDVIWKQKRPPLPDGCNECIRKIIQKCWDKDPMKRLSAHEVGTRLQRLLYQLNPENISEFNMFPQATWSLRGSSRDLFSRTFFQPKPKVQRQLQLELLENSSRVSTQADTLIQTDNKWENDYHLSINVIKPNQERKLRSNTGLNHEQQRMIVQ